MASSLKKTANALSQESELLNVYSDLKAVCSKFDSFLGATESSQKRILNWAERKEDDAVQDFLRSLYEIETERVASDRHYNEDFRVFVKLWKGILSEKKELNAKLKELDAARKNLRNMSTKVSRAEAREPAHKVTQRMEELEAAKSREADVSEEAAVKLLEVQQDKHQTLRNGYTGLYTATMKRAKDHVLLLEKMRQLVNSLPTVAARNEDGTYVLEKYTGPQQDAPIWWQGEQLFKQLQEIQQNHEEEKRRFAKEHAAKISDLAKQQDQMAKQFQQKHHGELSNMSEEQQQMVARMNAAHNAAVQDLEQQKQALIDAHAAQLAQEDKKYQKVVGQLRAMTQKLKEQTEAYALLDKTHEEAKLGIVTRSRTMTNDAVKHSMIWARQSCMNTFLDVAAQCKVCVDQLMPIFESESIDGQSEMIHTRLTSVANLTCTVLLSAAGAAQVSRAENSMQLVEDLKDLPLAVEGLLSWFEDAEKGDHDRTNDHENADTSTGADAPSPAQPAGKRVKALYKHEGKVQEGFTLIGFAKGDILVLVKRREDGWSRVRNDTAEGWAPTTYLQDYEDPAPAATPTPPAKAPRTATRVRQEAKTLVGDFHMVIDTAVETAKAIHLRDHELGKLSNQIANAIEDKISAAQQSINDAVKLFQRLLAQSKSTDTGRTLEVNSQLLERVLKLEHGMENVINAAEGLRAALIRTKGQQSESDFNAKHQGWFEALSGSVDAVFEGNPMLTESVRSVLGRKGKHEELQVATRNITAAVAQLSSLSKTKSMAENSADGESAQQLVVSRCAHVIETGADVLASVREAQDLALASVLMEDFTELTSNQAKRLTMATQVNVLKLEKELENEREKLGRLRRLNYD